MVPWDKAVVTPSALLFPTAGETTIKQGAECVCVTSHFCVLLYSINVYGRQEVFLRLCFGVRARARVCEWSSDWYFPVFVFDTSPIC